jgi:hypothetical protein
MMKKPLEPTFVAAPPERAPLHLVQVSYRLGEAAAGKGLQELRRASLGRRRAIAWPARRACH